MLELQYRVGNATLGQGQSWRGSDGRLLSMGSGSGSGSAHSQGLARSPPLFHLLLCFCNLYFWLCFPFTFLIAGFWKNSTLVSVGLRIKGIVCSLARVAEGCWVPAGFRWGGRGGKGEACSLGGRGENGESQAVPPSWHSSGSLLLY